MAILAGTQGTVYTSFIVEKDGSISNVKILRGIGNGCDEETLRIIKAMPKWKPGKQMNTIVRVQVKIPVRFILDN
jgi:protein TonB